MSSEDKKPTGEEIEQEDSEAANPEERAFSGHPDHPPATPDQPLEGNEELLRRGDEAPEEFREQE